MTEDSGERDFQPFLPPIDSSKLYTLVLDLDETLIHYSENTEREGNHSIVMDDDSPTYFVRSGLFTFLTRLSPYYEIVIFTAALKEYADYFVQRIDHKKVISYILHREHCQISDTGRVTKDLRLLGRDLSKTLIIDNLEDNFRVTPDNGILIPDFIDDFKDDWLYMLKDFLKKVAENQVEDIRVALKKYRDRYQEYQ